MGENLNYFNNKSQKASTHKEIDLEFKKDVKIPSTEELEKLKETDFEEYLYWIDYIIKIEQQKHDQEAEREELEKKKKELDELHTRDPEWWKN